MPFQTDSAASIHAAFRRFDILFSRAAAGVASFSPEGTLVGANDRTLDWIGRNRGEAIGTLSIAQFSPSSELQRAVLQGAGATLECALSSRDGTAMPVLITTAPMLDDAGAYVLSRLWILDLSARQAAEKKLRVSEEAMARAQALTHFGHYEADLSHDIASPDLLWSKEFFHILGIDPSRGPLTTIEFIQQCVYPDDRGRFMTFVDECVKGNRGGVLEYRVVTPQGEVRHVRDVAELQLQPDGTPRRFFGVLQDITELGEAQAQLRQLTKHLLDVREQERQQLALELHDELGSVLTAAKMYVADAAEQVGMLPGVNLDFPLNKALELLDIAIHSTRRITTDLRPSVLDLHGMRTALQWLADNFVGGAGVKCDLDIAEGALELLDGDASRAALFRIVQEAMRNAVQHADASRVRVRARRAAGWVEIEIEDDGKGVSLDGLRRSGSVGVLGMQERARALGGSFSLQSELGTGTRVIVRLPTDARTSG